MIFLGKPIEQIMGAGALLLALGCVLVLQPFLSAILWAAIVCFSTWPVYQRCERFVGGNKSLAAAVMTLLVALVLVAPFAVMVPTLTDRVGNLPTAVNQVLEQGPPAPPRWVAGLPVVGETVAAYWESLAHNAPTFLIELKKLIGPATNLAVASGAVLGAGLLELGLSVFIAFFLFLHGRQMAAYVRAVGERFAGPRSRKLLTVVGATVKGVIYGLIGTALAQAVLAGIGFWIAGVPQALSLGFLTFFLSFVPAGPPLVWGSVALWFFVQGAVWWGLFVAAWGLLLVSSIDNVLRPYVLGRTNSLSVLLGLFGFLGGVMAFGFIGVFLGPTLLAVAYSLFREWHAAEVKGNRHSTSAPLDAD
ncbi:AI-2E family transporter [Neorhizobium sp. DT-125]|uniref:AI-2E family transporter n=1 Tax=Neorhizobium sp. DT-125 TaxID=3396163 RepID=UPI003F1E238D